MVFLQLPTNLEELGFNDSQLIDSAQSVKQNEATASTQQNALSTEYKPVIQATPPVPTSITATQQSPQVNYSTFTNSAINYSIANQRFNVFRPEEEKPSEEVVNAFIDSADVFTIGQYNEKGEIDRTFKFSLLPAIESSINGRQVPEVKPGILKRSSTNIKTFTLPGGIPAFQVLGLDTSILQLVGLFIGAETIEEEKPTIVFSNSKDITSIYSADSKLIASKLSKYFEEKFVQTGRPVIINISTNNSILRIKWSWFSSRNWEL